MHDLFRLNCPKRDIAADINSKRKRVCKTDCVVAKDVQNYCFRTKKELPRNEGEEHLLELIAKKIMAQDKECIKLLCDHDGELRLTYLQTSHMKKNVERNPHLICG